MLRKVKNREYAGNLMEEPEPLPEDNQDVQIAGNLGHAVWELGSRGLNRVTRPIRRLFKKKVPLALLKAKPAQLPSPANPNNLPIKHPGRLAPVASSVGSKLGTGLITAGKGAIMGGAFAGANVLHGFNKRMDQYERANSMYESEEPESTPSTKGRVNRVIPSTSTSVYDKPTSEPGKLKPEGKGVYKSKKPQTSEPPKKAKIVKPIRGQSSQNGQTEVNNETSQLQNRAMDFRQRLAGITMIQNPVKSSIVTAPANKPQQAKESAIDFMRGVLNLREAVDQSDPNWMLTRCKGNEKRIAKEIKSKANLGIKIGTPVKHSFISNDKKQFYSGRNLAMRQKIMSEHKRKGFPLHPNFPNMSPAEIGVHFDELSDQGMLEDRPNLDTGRFNYWKRRAGRVTGRFGRKVKGFLSGVVDKFRSKESENASVDCGGDEILEGNVDETNFCNYKVGNVKYRSECGCDECLKLQETSETSFGANLRGDTQDSEELIPKSFGTDIAKKRLLKRRKNKKIMREAYEDAAYKNTIRKDLIQHLKNPRIESPTNKGYFNSHNLLLRLDNLGMMLAKTAIATQGLPLAMRGALQGTVVTDWKNAKDNVVGNVKMLWAALKGHKVFEADTPEYAHTWSPDSQEGFADPLKWAKGRVKSAVGKNVYKLGKTLNSNFIKSAALPLSHIGGHLVTVGGLYAGKKLVYDPIMKKMRSLHDRVSNIELRKKE